MSIKLVKQALVVPLTTMVPLDGQTALTTATVFPTASDFISSSLPACVIHLAPAPYRHKFINNGDTTIMHTYYLCINILIGLLEEPNDQLITRVEAYPVPLVKALAYDITLGGACLFIGDGNTKDVGESWVGPIRWADGYYYGMQHILMINEVIDFLPKP